MAAAGLAAVVWLAACGGVERPDLGSGSDGVAGAGPYLIAYNVLEDSETDDYEVFVMEMDGSGQRNVTDDPGVDWAYVADGDRLYSVSDRNDERRKFHLYELTVDGSAPRRITEFRVRDSWLAVRSGGAELVVVSAKDGPPDLYLIDRDGNELERLTDDDAKDRDPVFSPDGRRLAWVSERSGLDELWLMDLESGETRQLTRFPADDPGREQHGYHAGPPFWEPHRDVISFCSKRNGNHSIFTIRPDGSELTQITGDEFDECWHSWSPDGRYLSYDGTDEDRNYDIYLRNMETGETSRLTTDARYEQAPVFVERTAG